MARAQANCSTLALLSLATTDIQVQRIDDSCDYLALSISVDPEGERCESDGCEGDWLLKEVVVVASPPSHSHPSPYFSFRRDHLIPYLGIQLHSFS
jgi:hypothetical protein